MQAILAVLNGIEEKINASHGATISRFLDSIEDRLDKLAGQAEHCSYAAALGDYVGVKIALHHVTRLMADVEDKSGNAGKRAHEYERQMRTLHANMYDNVCGDCDACLSRRSAWPTKSQSVSWSAANKWPDRKFIGVDPAKSHGVDPIVFSMMTRSKDKLVIDMESRDDMTFRQRVGWLGTPTPWKIKGN